MLTPPQVGEVDTVQYEEAYVTLVMVGPSKANVLSVADLPLTVTVRVRAAKLGRVVPQLAVHVKFQRLASVGEATGVALMVQPMVESPDRVLIPTLRVFSAAPV